VCGRYFIEIDEDELRDIGAEAERLVNAFMEQVNLKTSGEIFPTNIVPVQTGKNRFVPMKWGFTSYDKKNIINARSETALQKTMFKRPMLESRCLIPASGYYEWKRGEDKKTKYQFYTPGSPIYFAGCYRSEKGSPIRSFVILTKQAENGLEEFHDRMPVIIPRGRLEAWLNEGPDAMEPAVVDLAYKEAV
jgi:putative SOS response-associated peptidase YedK